MFDLIDGDQLMATIAGQWATDGRLAGGGFVATVMSGLGLERYLGALVRTKVGDRNDIELCRIAQVTSIWQRRSGFLSS